jgi:hypothetical protein
MPQTEERRLDAVTAGISEQKFRIFSSIAKRSLQQYLQKINQSFYLGRCHLLNVQCQVPRSLCEGS